MTARTAACVCRESRCVGDLGEGARLFSGLETGRWCRWYWGGLRVNHEEWDLSWRGERVDELFWKLQRQREHDGSWRGLQSGAVQVLAGVGGDKRTYSQLISSGTANRPPANQHTVRSSILKTAHLMPQVHSATLKPLQG